MSKDELEFFDVMFDIKQKLSDKEYKDILEVYCKAVDDKRVNNSQVEVVSPNIDVYEGEYRNGKCHGRGKTIYANGDVYEGEFKDGKRNGRGKMICGSGDVYE